VFVATRCLEAPSESSGEGIDDLRVLLWHGYLMTGSGSNLYTANLARVWRRAGHDVLLLCQETKVESLGFADEQGDFSSDNLSFTTATPGIEPAAGRCRLVRPFINGLLPVYVYDDYEGFVVKRFVDLTDDELARYTDSNVEALVTAIEEHRPEAIVTGHEVMGPYIALQATSRTGHHYLAKLHGSALEYAVKEQKERYLPYAREGLTGARVVTGGSNYMVKEASSVVTGWERNAAVVNPGCDIEIFSPSHAPRSSPPAVGYVGKFIVSKGVHNFLAALGCVSQQMRAVVVGYGGYESELKELASGLAAGDEDAVRAVAEKGDGNKSLVGVLEWLDDNGMDDSYIDRARRIEVEWPGRLDHGPLAEVLPTFELLVVPSVVPEAFGMVAAEAAACAVLPIVPAHSGIGEVGAILETELGRPGLLTFDPADPVRGIATTVDRLLALDPEERRSLGMEAARVARELWSWEHVADQLLRLAVGGKS
jgi:glycosyltransferase involved in cell wall biosynthesis